MKIFAFLLTILALPALAGELGTRIGWEEGFSGQAWATFSGEFLGLSLTGRGEVELLPLRPKLLSFSAAFQGPGLRLAGGGKLLGTGRLDLFSSVELVGETSWGELELTGRLGGRGTWAAVLSGGPLGWGVWTTGRAEWRKFWGETRLEASLPGGTPQVRLAMGGEGAGRVALRVSLSGPKLSGASLELGAAGEPLSGSFQLGLYPKPSGTASVRASLGGWTWQGRLSLASGRWRGSLSLGTELSQLKLRATLRFTREGFTKGELEARLPLGD